jgi:hypothetical protein
LLAGGDHVPQPRRVEPEPDAVLGEQLQGDVGQEDPFDRGGFQLFQQRRDVEAPLRADQVQVPAPAEGREDLLERHVERQHRELLGRRGRRALPLDQVGQGAVRDTHALGHPGRAGGEQRVERPSGVPGRDAGHRPFGERDESPFDAGVDRVERLRVTGSEQHATRPDPAEHVA